MFLNSWVWMKTFPLAGGVTVSKVQAQPIDFLSLLLQNDSELWRELISSGSAAC